MLRLFPAAALVACLAVSGTAVAAAQVRGQYLEARSCDVYTGPCFANAEMGLAGREAVMAWKFDSGNWNGVSVEGLTVALVLKAERHLGSTEAVPAEPGRVDSVILVDESADAAQESALLSFLENVASEYTRNIRDVRRAPMTFQADHATCECAFTAGDEAEIRTRSLGKNDCVCTNEMVYYEPLNELHNVRPAYALAQSYRGAGLDSQWTLNNTRSAFLATFRK